MSAKSGPEQKEVSTIDKRTDHRKALDRRRFVRDCPSPRPDRRRLNCGVFATLVVWTARVGRSMDLSIGCVRRPNEKGRFFLSNHRRFRSNFLGHALGLDHHGVLLNFRANVLKHAKTEGFFQQRELHKTDTAREVCVGMVAQIAVKVSICTVEDRCCFVMTFSSTTATADCKLYCPLFLLSFSFLFIYLFIFYLFIFIFIFFL